jgi:hypothetical protein
MSQKFPKSSQFNFNKNLVKRHKFVTHLDTFLASEPTGFEFKYESKVGDNAWHPSGDCLPSVTDLYEKATTPYVPRDISSSLQKTFLVGHFWHQVLQWATVEIGLAEPWAIECKREFDWSDSGGSFNTRLEDRKPYHWISGSADIAPLVLPNSDEYLVDFKTMGNHDYKSAGMPAWAALKYEAQINIYMELFDMEKSLIVAVQKDSPHDMKEFEFRRNQPLIDAIFDKWKFVSELVSANQPPSELDNEEFKLDGLFEGPIAQ